MLAVIGSVVNGHLRGDTAVGFHSRNAERVTLTLTLRVRVRVRVGGENKGEGTLSGGYPVQQASAETRVDVLWGRR
jgi:hypothetical protein